MNLRAPEKIHDVVIIGSGAAGGMAAWNLTRQGVNVLVLDAGERFDRGKFWSHVKPWQANARHERGEHAPEFYLSTKEQPYRTPRGQAFRLGERLGARRQNKRVGACFAALFRCGF